MVLTTRLRFGSILRPWLIHRRVQLFFDFCAGAAAMGLAYLLRFDFDVPVAHRGPMGHWSLVAGFIMPSILWVSRGYNNPWQFFGLRDIGSLFWRALGCFLLLTVFRLGLGSIDGVPFSISLIWLGAFLALSCTARIARRMDHEAVLRAMRPYRRTLIVGTEESLVSAIRQSHTWSGSKIIGLAADNLKGSRLAGFRVLGSTVDIAALVLEHRIEVVLASTASMDCLAAIITTCLQLDVEFRLLPSLSDIAENKVHVMRRVSPEALRENLAKEAELHPDVVTCLEGQVVLITGAGGSIGSELARQIARVAIRKLVVLDQDENSMFDLINEIGQSGPIVCHICDIRNVEAVQKIFSQHLPSVVFHAAAYKHVPLMESNPCEAVITNVAGTNTVAHAALQAGTARFVLISTDKAVQPSSIMGASKRLAEMVVQRCAAVAVRGEGQGKTQFACVRFGNVLGSRGSVLPVFLKQIAAGAPITVTNAEMTRYFMTIPEAVRLLLQAATLASSGDVYMLDMGDPVRIIDLARNLVKACGLVVGRDVEIKVVGSRPGEKLHEQLWNEDSEISRTIFPQVRRVHAAPVPLEFVSGLDELITAAQERRSDDVRTLLQAMPVDYDVARVHKEVVPIIENVEHRLGRHTVL